MRTIFFNLSDHVTVVLTNITQNDEDIGFVGVIEHPTRGVIKWKAYIRPLGYEIILSHFLNDRPLHRIHFGMSPNWDLGASVAHIFLNC